MATGRPTKLDDLTKRRIIDALRAGMSRRGAAAAARVGWSTFKEWMVDGRADVEPFAAFLAQVLEAEAQPEREVVDALMQAAKGGSVPAITFWLKCRRGKEWNDRDIKPENDEAADAAEANDLDVARSVVAALESRKVG